MQIMELIKAKGATTGIHCTLDGLWFLRPLIDCQVHRARTRHYVSRWSWGRRGSGTSATATHTGNRRASQQNQSQASRGPGTTRRQSPSQKDERKKKNGKKNICRGRACYSFSEDRCDLVGSRGRCRGGRDCQQSL